MLTLKESLGNVKIICDEALLDKKHRIAIDESLNNIAGALQAHEVMLAAAEEEKKKPQPEKEPDEDKD
jgi:hypothetical protein